MIRSIRQAVLWLTGVVLVVATAMPGPATAEALAPDASTAGVPGLKDPPPPHIDPWIPATCATAEFDQAYVDPPQGGLVLGTVTRCGTYITDSKYALAVYWPDEIPVVYTSQLRSFLVDRPTIGVQLLVGNGPVADGVGVCALLTSNVRMGCARLSEGPDGLVVESIPVNDPLVLATATVIYDGTPDVPDPGCANCV
ncbi:hypothetical protein O7608_21810 [Solwaraspora sp. WMMA2056]|uniref:hypothetical protein n=1 Tax=Solwaraspora sp. WMMA2056 TaxID=3015161 RepID=UPI00259BC69B|nr:hypothetical protein [Solwaraspora sp. WMMA2056]WJK39107.1 hypothetical protein O7608_21810 [Solwaraspora sp. WMMA2056]